MKIAVLVDLEFSDRAGGHVKYWQRICESLKSKKKRIDITVFFLGNSKKTINLTKSIRFQILKPILSSGILKKIGVDADHTDLFPLNLYLLFKLKEFDLIHSTDQFFTMAKTAKLASFIWKIPLTTSIHTDTPPYTKYYVKKIIENIFSSLFNFDKFLIGKLKIPDYFEERMYNKIYRYIKNVNHAMVADKIYSPEYLKKKTNNLDITKLNRGIDDEVFFIKKEEKFFLCKQYGIPFNDKIIFFTGRVHELKGAIHLANIHKKLIESGLSVTTLIAGEGVHAEKCKSIGGDKLILLGYQSQEKVAQIYRLCDLFVFPSKFEIGPNVVIEAKACGAICLVSPGGGGKRIEKNNYDGLIIEDFCVHIWVKNIIDLLKDKKKIKAMKNNINNMRILSWYEVFKKDIFPIWEKYKK